MKTILAIIGAGVVFLWAMGMIGFGDFVLCAGPHGTCQRSAK